MAAKMAFLSLSQPESHHVELGQGKLKEQDRVLMREAKEARHGGCIGKLRHDPTAWANVMAY
jgi:hypothetical protein